MHTFTLYTCRSHLLASFFLPSPPCIPCLPHLNSGHVLHLVVAPPLPVPLHTCSSSLPSCVPHQVLPLPYTCPFTHTPFMIVLVGGRRTLPPACGICLYSPNTYLFLIYLPFPSCYVYVNIPPPIPPLGEEILPSLPPLYCALPFPYLHTCSACITLLLLLLP